MNASLVSAGMKWKVISVGQRDQYMDALEKASVTGDIANFSRIVMGAK